MSRVFDNIIWSIVGAYGFGGFWAIHLFNWMPDPNTVASLVFLSLLFIATTKLKEAS